MRGLLTGVGQPSLDFLTKQPVEGTLLSDRLAQGALLGPEALDIAIEVGNQLHQAHSLALTHGSLSPESICVTASGAVHILAPLLHPRPSTLAYRSPEQVRGNTPDARSDIFAFGAILYEMVVGTPAFLGDGQELSRSILHDPAPTLTLRSPIYDAMARVITGCLEKNPAARRQRIQNAVIELRFAAKANAILGGRAAGAASGQPLPPSFTPKPSAGAAASIYLTDAAPSSPPLQPSGRKRPVDPPRAEEFLFRPGEPIVKPRPARADQIRALLENNPAISLSGFSVHLWVVIGAGLAIILLFAVGIALYLHPRSAAPVVKFAVTPPEHTSYPGSPSISPDGKLLVFSAQGPEGRRMLWLRPLDAMRHTPITGTEGATNPFWSPDGQSLAYFTTRALKMVRIKDGYTETICQFEGSNAGGTWNRDGIILFARNADDGLYQVAARANSNPTPILKVNPSKGENGYMWPQFLPDGKHFLFYIQTEATETSGVYSAALDSQEYRLLFPSETNALYSGLPDSSAQKKGYLLYISNRKLMGQAFSASRLSVVGEPVILADDIGAVSSMNLAPISVAANGTLAYQSTGQPTRQLIWTDRTGAELATIREPGTWSAPHISPDGRRAIAAKFSQDAKYADVFVVDPDGSMKLFFHSEGSSLGSPIWSPDGSKVAFSLKNADNNFDIYVRSIEAGARPDLLFRSSFVKHTSDWSRDGRYLFFDGISEGTKHDIWAVSTADRHAGPILNTVADEQYPALSPDGKFLAFNSDEGGPRQEVFVQQFDGISSTSKRRWKVSNTGGGIPHWRADGKELFFLTPNGRLMASEVSNNKGEISFGPPVKLFQTRPLRRSWNLYDVAPDGQRFLINAPLEWALSSDIMVITNWTEKLRD